MVKRAILFDLDGTLADTYDLILASQRYATQKVLGRVIPDEVLMSTVGIPLEEQMRDHTDDPILVEEICRVYHEHNAKIIQEMTKGFPGVLNVVVQLDKVGVPMGIVTSKRIDAAMPSLRKLGFEPYMKCFIGGGETTHHKPHPEPILKGCQAIGFSPEDCIYVGDSPFDIQAGNTAGCRTIAVTWGMHSRESLQSCAPTFIADNAEDLLKYCI